MKKMPLVILSLFLAAFSISAQNNLNNFLGTWKDVKKDKSRSTILNVAIDGENLKIEKTITDKNSAALASETRFYKTDGSFSFDSVNEIDNASMERKLTLVKSNKLVLESVMKQNRATTPFREVNFKDVWTLSADGKTLTIESIAESSMTGVSAKAPSYTIKKYVYEKQ